MAKTRDAKAALRQEMKSILSQLGEDEIEAQSIKVAEKIKSLPQYQNATRISLYLSMPKGELRTTSIVQDALNSGKKVFIPYTSGKGRSAAMDMLRLSSLEELNTLKSDSWGIPALPKDSIDDRENAAGGTGLAEIEVPEALYGDEAQRAGRDVDPGRGREGGLDLVLLPGVAFDVGLNRLGHGAGYYDGFLTRFCGDGTMKPFLVGLGLTEQLLPEGREVPTTDSDWILDALVLGDGRLLTMDD